MFEMCNYAIDPLPYLSGIRVGRLGVPVHGQRLEHALVPGGRQLGLLQELLHLQEDHHSTMSVSSCDSFSLLFRMGVLLSRLLHPPFFSPRRRLPTD